MEKTLISVIVPVFNVEEYLQQCVESLLAQTYANIEVILVDDGSTDGSGAMCDVFATSDSRIKVIHKANGGVSSARNVGLKAVRGKYVGFVDPDDYISPHMYQRLYDAIQTDNVGIVCCGFNLVNETDSVSIDNIKSYEIATPHIVNSSEYLSFFIDNLSVLPINNLWSKLYDIDVARDIGFVDGRTNEDAYFCYHLKNNVVRLKRDMLIIPDKLYYYRLRVNSITTSNNKVFPVDEILNLSEMVAECKNINPETFAKLRHKYMWHLNSGIAQIMRDRTLYDRYIKILHPYYKATPLSYFLDGYYGIARLKVALNTIAIKYLPSVYHKVVTE